MTQDEIIEMARFAGIRINNFGFQGGYIEEFEAFAHFVAAKERKACVLECADFIDSKFNISPYSGEVVSYADGGQLKEHFGIEL
jgi:hypothetical protein